MSFANGFTHREDCGVPHGWVEDCQVCDVRADIDAAPYLFVPE
jgi:hypothetical protein